MTWTTNDIPDLKGKIALVTGGNSGIGYWTCLHLALAGAKVTLACRSMPRAEAAVADLLKAAPNGHFEILPLDLSNQASVHSAAATFRSKHDRLDMLCNNAGIALAPMERTKDGFESQLAANFLGHFALTGLLIDIIRTTPNSRVAHLGSLAHRLGKINFEDPNFQHRKYSPLGAYGQSKLTNVMFMLELQRRFQRANINSISVGAHPGMSGTNIGAALVENASPLKKRINAWIEAKILNSPEHAAEPTLLALTRPEVAGGSYFGPSGFMEIKGPPVPAHVASAAHNESDASRLWTLAEQLTGVSFLND
ncbi:MAG: oxidoreductase [Pseudomonadota bacterium]